MSAPSDHQDTVHSKSPTPPASSINQFSLNIHVASTSSSLTTEDTCQVPNKLSTSYSCSDVLNNLQLDDNDPSAQHSKRTANAAGLNARAHQFIKRMLLTPQEAAELTNSLFALARTKRPASTTNFRKLQHQRRHRLNHHF
jgi:hypothetical protein